jgi:hypothetical protein
LARELGHPHTLAVALNLTSVSYQFRQETMIVREQMETLLTLSIEHGFVLRVAQATVLRGWALAAEGQREEGIAQMREGLAAERARSHPETS